MEISLNVENVTKTFSGYKSVDNLSFSVKKGEIFGFLGENGAGKTTTIRMILDIIRPDSGNISVMGSSPGSENSRKIGFLAEERGLYAKMSAIDTIEYFGQLKGMSGRQARKNGLEILERFQIADRAKSEINTLSKGMAQKVQLATALVNNPELLILDEPFSGLDPVNQKLLEDEILHAAKQGASVIFSTHIMQNADRLCERMLILKKGIKKFEGTINQARNMMPRKITIVSNINPEGLAGASIISMEEQGDTFGKWEVILPPEEKTENFLHKITSLGAILNKFEEKQHNMHEIFMHYVEKENEQ